MMAAETVSMQNRGPTVLTVTITMLCLSTTFIILRLISRFGIVTRVNNDDYAIVLAWIIAFGFSFSICYGTSVGLGRHEVDVRPEQRHPLKKAQYAFSVLYNPALMATKTSICLFYLTLSKNHQIFKWTTIATLVVVNVAGLALTILNIFQCRPVGAAFKDPLSQDASCTNIVTLYLSSAPVNIITDLAILFLPMPILTSMRLPRNEKIILIITFSFGAFVAVVDVVRIAYLESAALAGLQNKADSASVREEGDFSWIASLSFMWSAVEVHVGMICACVPVVKPLVTKLFPTLLGRIKAASDLQDDNFTGPGDAQWANVARKSLSSSPAPKSPIAPRSSMGPMSPIAPRSPMSPTPQSDPSNCLDSDPNQNMDMIHFLTTPDTTAATLKHQEARATCATTASGPQTPSPTIFDFVNVKNPRSMVKMSNKESIFPNALVTILFFLWGFAYGLLDVLNQHFQVVVHISSGQAIGLHSAYYGAYFVGPLTFGQYVFRKWGFKSTFMLGLCIYGIGTLVFWPSAVLASFPAFLISNFIIGLGMATLETAGNPFISLCGPPEYAEVRLNISQGVQAIGSVVSPIFAKQVLFKNVRDAPSLIDIQWTYLGIAFFDVILAVIFYYLPIPEATDDELEELAQKKKRVDRRKVLGVPVIFTTLVFGIFSQFCYVGGQEVVSIFYQEYVAAVRPYSTVSPFNYQAIGHTVFAVGRFLTAALGLWLKPRHILILLYVGAITTSALAMSLCGYSGVAMLVLILFFESGIFSLVFAISLRGLGRSTKWGAVLLTASTSGGAVFPAAVSPVKGSRGVQYAFAVVVAVFSFGAIMPIYLETVATAKKQVDPVRTPKKQVMGKAETREKRASGFNSIFIRRRKGKDVEGSETNVSTNLPDVEHVDSPKGRGR
ncbi:MAG: hypothetical protein Q9217_004164 [Psora testacea]